MAEAPKGLYHCVNCTHLKGLRIELTAEWRKHRKGFAILGLSSKETIGAGLRAVDASPFKTVFVVRESSGEILFALSKNDEYINIANKKKKPTPPTTPPVEPISDCCMKCRYEDGTRAPCENISDDACICYNEERGQPGRPGGIDDELETLAF